MEGKSVRCWPDSKIPMVIDYWVNGVKDGLHTSFYPDGSPCVSVMWIKRKEEAGRRRSSEEGEYTRKHENGVVHVEATFKNGSPVGMLRRYDRNGKLIFKVDVDEFNKGKGIDDQINSVFYGE